MAEIIREIGAWISEGPIVLSVLAIGAIVYLIKTSLPVVHDLSLNITRLSDAIDGLERSNGKLFDRFGDVEQAIDNLTQRVDHLEQSGTINRPQ